MINHRRSLRRFLMALSVAAAAAATAMCGSSPTPPSPPPVVETPNASPVITSITAGAQRVEANDEVQLTATVTDAETNVDQLTYKWEASISGGTFSGTGRDVRWRAPIGVTTPDTAKFTLTVVEDYRSNNQPKQNQTTGTVSVHYNDSKKEVGDISVQFLRNFATYTMSPEECVRSFSDSCQGKRDELQDIRNERNLFQILGADLTLTRVDVDAARTQAQATVTCVFYDVKKSTGARERVPGICTLTAVYENWQWWLCTSHFTSTGPVTPYDLQYRVPGRLTGPTPLRSPYE